MNDAEFRPPPLHPDVVVQELKHYLEGWYYLIPAHQDFYRWQVDQMGYVHVEDSAHDIPGGSQLKQCYRNATFAAIQRQGWSVVVGYMISEGLPIPIAHAWNMDEKGTYYDLTEQFALRREFREDRRHYVAIARLSPEEMVVDNGHPWIDYLYHAYHLRTELQTSP